MIKKMRMITEAFREGGGGFRSSGVRWVISNCLISLLAIITFSVWGTPRLNPDTINAVLTTGMLLVMLFMFIFVSFIPLKRWIKTQILVGVLLIQIAQINETMVNLYTYAEIPVEWLGSLIFLMGGVLVSFGVSNWVVLIFRLSTLDALTHLHNRRFFESMVEQFIARSRENAASGCLLCVDMDNFKAINDGFGHATGDKVLKRVAKVLKANARKDDVLCRSGGEEFELLLQGANALQAQEIANRILLELAKATPKGLPTLSASIGITRLNPGDNSDSFRVRADNAMYQAKSEGKARVVFAG